MPVVTNGSIIIWIIDARIDLRSGNTWLRNVITHELSHIMTLEKQSSPQLLDWTFSLSYRSPHSAVSIGEPFATTMFWPEWFAEGIAQRESARAGNDCWDSRRDMVLRNALLFSRPLTFEEMGNFNHTGLGNEMVYNQGFSFMLFLEKTLGRSTIKGLFNDGRATTFFPRNFYDYFQERTGQSIVRLYEQWIDSSRQISKRQVPAEPTPTKTLWDRGFYNSMPKSSPNGRTVGWLTNDKDDFDRTDLLIAPTGAIDKYVRIPYALSSWDFSPSGDKVYFIKAYWPNENGSFLNDIFVFDLTRSVETRLTKNARVYDIAASPDNACLVWVRYDRGVFSLVKSDCSGKNPVTIIDGVMGEPFAGLSFDPNDPNKLVTTRLISGKARLFLADIHQKSIAPLCVSNTQEESPVWAKNGRIYFSADFDGIFNIYSIKPDNTDLRRHTNTATGLFSPNVVDGPQMLCSEYRGNGFKVVTLDAGAGEPYQVPDSSRCSFQELPAAKGKVSIKSFPYEARLLRPVWELQTSAEVFDNYGKLENMQNSTAFRDFADSMAYSVSAAILMSQSDALDKRAFWMGLQGAVEWEGKIRDTSASALSVKTSALFPKVSIDKRNPDPFSSRLAPSGDRKPYFLSNQELAAIGETYFSYNRLQPTNAASSDSSSPVIPILVPGLGWQNSENAVTLGLSVQGMFLNGILPGIINLDGASEWQISRNVYLDFNPQIECYPFTLFSGTFIAMTDLPFSVLWSFYGYENADMQYNMSGETMLRATIEPAFFPITKKSYSDTAIDAGASARYGLEGAHGFPLSRYSSLIVSASGFYTAYSELVNDPKDTLIAMSRGYTSANLEAAYTFPLARQINKGARYADALYAELLYDVSLYANRDLSASMVRGALTKPTPGPADSGRVVVSHFVGAGINMGFIKSYTFSQMLSLRVLWDFWAKCINVNLSFSM